MRSDSLRKRNCYQNFDQIQHYQHWRLPVLGPTWGPPGSCRPQMGPMLAPWTLLSGLVIPNSTRRVSICVLIWNLTGALATKSHANFQNDRVALNTNFVALSDFMWCHDEIFLIRYWNRPHVLTQWGRVAHIYVSRLPIIGSDNDLSSHGRRPAIIWTYAEILLIEPLGTKFTELLIEIHAFHSWKCIWKCCLRNGCHFVYASMC